MTSAASLAADLVSVQQRIGAAARRAGRDSAEITVVAVTKTQPTEVIRLAYDLGLRHLGENRVEEAELKVPGLPADLTWHMVGHIQGRKAKRVPALFQVVHSVDSVELAGKLDRACTGRNQPLPVLLEMNVSGEVSKFGFPAWRWADDEGTRRDLVDSVKQILELPQLQVEGLMTMAPVVVDQEEARPVFSRLRLILNDLRQIFPKTAWRHLSMGMSDDFEVAVEEGSTLVRIGRAIFAPDRPAWRK